MSFLHNPYAWLGVKRLYLISYRKHQVFESQTLAASNTGMILVGREQGCQTLTKKQQQDPLLTTAKEIELGMCTYTIVAPPPPPPPPSLCVCVFRMFRFFSTESALPASASWLV